MRALVLAAFLLLGTADAAEAVDLVRSAKRLAVERDYSVPSPIGHFTAIEAATAYGLGTVWCGATALIIASARHGELPLMRAWEIVANCVLPVVGGYAVRQWAKRHPEWTSKNFGLKPWKYDPGRTDW